MTNQIFIERAEAARDLKAQLGSLSQDDEQEIQFTEWSPGRKLVTIWNTETGEEVTLPRYQAIAAIYAPNSAHDGYMWTAHKEQAPERRLGTVKCFLHPESAYRAFLDEIGINTICRSSHFMSEPAMWAQARSKHPSAYKAYQDELARREREEDRAEQRKQTEAMLALANRDEGQRRGRLPKED